MTLRHALAAASRLTQVRCKGTLDNYLQNRFKLDGNLFCRNVKIQNELKLIS